jgi:hypothetical protein
VQKAPLPAAETKYLFFPEGEEPAITQELPQTLPKTFAVAASWNFLYFQHRKFDCRWLQGEQTCLFFTCTSILSTHYDSMQKVR